MVEWPKAVEADLLECIAQEVEENLHLDYKDSRALKKDEQTKNEMSKDVSAFANSAGGTIVFGISEANHKPEAIDAGVDPQEFTKEWMEQVLMSRISPRIPNLVIRPVPLTTQRPGRVAYVVVVPQSPRAPHMAADHRYHKRYNFMSVAMEHYEVEDTRRRHRGPDLHIEFEADTWEPRRTQWDFQPKFRLHPLIVNESDEPAESALVEMFVSRALKLGDRGSAEEGPEKRFEFEGTARSFQYFKEIVGRERLVPIFKTVRWSVLRRPFTVDLDGRPIVPALAFHLGWQIRASRMEVRYGAYRGAVTLDGVLLEPFTPAQNPFPQ